MHVQMTRFTFKYTHLISEAYLTQFILLNEKLLQFDWLRAVVFQLILKYLHVKITNVVRIVV